MGTNTLETAYSNGQIIDASHINELTAAVINQFVGRNTSGVPEVGKSLGTAAIPWGAIHAESLLLNGLAVDTSQITSAPNRIVGGATRADSEQPDFLRVDGSAATLTVLGASTNITLAINGQGATVSTDIVKSGLTLAPSANNTCDVNDVGVINSLYAGESDAAVKEIILDNVGSEIAARVGQYVGFKAPTGEIMYGYLKNSTTLTNVFRGYFFNSSGAPIPRDVLSDNDTLTLVNIGWIFVEDNGTTVDITYSQPVYSFEAPSGPTVGQYWFDISNQTWKRYSGTEFEIINRIIVGIVALDDTAAIGARSADFTNNFDRLNTIDLSLASSEIVESKNFESRINVYGVNLYVEYSKLIWNITSDLESGLVEASSTDYYLYVSTKGRTVLSSEKPYLRKDLQGYYHPYQSWRCVGVSFNDVSSDLVLASCLSYNTSKNNLNVVVSHQESSGTGGGSTSGGNVVTRAMNTVEGADSDSIYLNSSQIFIAPGTYKMAGFFSAYECDRHQSFLYNVDTTTYEVVGSSEYMSNSLPVTTKSLINTTKTFDKTTIYEARHYAQTTKTSGLGFAANATGNPQNYELYASLTFETQRGI